MAPIMERKRTISLEKRIKTFERMFVEKIDAHCGSRGYALTNHFLYRMVRD